MKKDREALLRRGKQPSWTDELILDGFGLIVPNLANLILILSIPHGKVCSATTSQRRGRHPKTPAFKLGARHSVERFPRCPDACLVSSR